MARTPEISEAAYAADVGRLKAMGYNVSKLRKVPQGPLQNEGGRRFEATAARPSSWP
jgi:hypothetical protein